MYDIKMRRHFAGTHPITIWKEPFCLRGFSRPLNSQSFGRGRGECAPNLTRPIAQFKFGRVLNPASEQTTFLLGFEGSMSPSSSVKFGADGIADQPLIRVLLIRGAGTASILS
jgi:hypothetical protein